MYDEFRTIYPEITYYKAKNKKTQYMTLKPNAWVDVIKDRFLKVCKLPCNFIYKKSYVTIDVSKSKHYLTFNEKCKDAACDNDFFGWSNSKPIR